MKSMIYLAETGKLWFQGESVSVDDHIPTESEIKKGTDRRVH